MSIAKNKTRRRSYCLECGKMIYTSAARPKTLCPWCEKLERDGFVRLVNQLPRSSEPTIYIMWGGDRSVGIQPVTYEVKLGPLEGLDEPCYRDGVRRAAEQLGEAIVGEPCHARFSDECWSCMSVLKAGACPRCKDEED